MLVVGKVSQTVELDIKMQIEVAVDTIRYLFNLPKGVYVSDGNLCYEENVGGHNNDTETRVLRKNATPTEKAALLTIDQLEKKR